MAQQASLRLHFLLLQCLQALFSVPVSLTSSRPTAIHLAPGSEPHSMLVQWITEAPRAIPQSPNSSTFARYSHYSEAQNNPSTATKMGEQHWAEATQEEFSYHGQQMTIHSAVMRKLQPSTRYVYQVGSEIDGWSQPYVFRSLPLPGSNASLSFVIFGDLGLHESISLPALVEEAKSGRLDLVIHAGDIGYDLEEVGVEFLQAVQEVTARVPYMVIPGNHDGGKHKFRFYNKLFRMPNSPDGSSQYYSVTIGPVHFVGLNTELYYPEHGDYAPARRQLEWLIRVLAAARAAPASPWLFVYQHRPLYCSTDRLSRCPHGGINVLRHGVDGQVDGLEPLYGHARVDLVVAGHEHIYERFHPTRSMHRSVTEIHSDTPLDLIRQPPAPIYLISGAAGNREHLHAFRSDPLGNSAVRWRRHGYTRVTVMGQVATLVEQLSVAPRPEVIDKFVIVK